MLSILSLLLFVQFVYSCALTQVDFGVSTTCEKQKSACCDVELCDRTYELVSGQCNGPFEIGQNLEEFASCLVESGGEFSPELKALATCLQAASNECTERTVECLVDEECSGTFDQVESGCLTDSDWYGLIQNLDLTLPLRLLDCAGTVSSSLNAGFSSWLTCATTNPGDLIPDSLCHNELYECYAEGQCAEEFSDMTAKCPTNLATADFTSWWECVVDFAKTQKDDQKFANWMHCVIQNFYPDAESEDGCMADIEMCESAASKDRKKGRNRADGDSGSDDDSATTVIIIGASCGGVCLILIFGYCYYVGSKAQGEVMQQGEVMYMEPHADPAPAAKVLEVETIGTEEFSEGNMTTGSKPATDSKKLGTNYE